VSLSPLTMRVAVIAVALRAALIECLAELGATRSRS